MGETASDAVATPRTSGRRRSLQEVCVIPEIILGFEVHQPLRLRRAFRREAAPVDPDRYFDPGNREILERVTDRCYDPATRIVLENLDAGHQFAFSYSGTLLEQLERWRPDTLELLGQVARHRNAEVLAQTYYHSVASLFHDKSEFARQVYQHMDVLWDLFHVRPVTFENTEFIYSNEIAAQIGELGFLAAYTEGVPRVLGDRSPNRLYLCTGMPTLLRNTHLSDEIAYRYGGTLADRHDPAETLEVEEYADEVAAIADPVVSVFKDFETYGEHFGAETGILDFLRALPDALAERGVTTTLPRRVIVEHQPEDVLSIPEPISWADREKDLSAWVGNPMQNRGDRGRRAGRGLRPRPGALAQPPDQRPLLLHGHEGRRVRRDPRPLRPPAARGGLRDLHGGDSRRSRSRGRRPCTTRRRRVRCARSRRGSRSTSGRRAAATGTRPTTWTRSRPSLREVPPESVRYHQSRGDLARWLRDAVGDGEVAARVEGLDDPAGIAERLDEAREDLWNRLS